ncbi:hypothetical protein PRUPE_1G159400 [Prunus persica]|uniref:Uncharacterized protein n=1 Tax=Prunus persica TaxID=3760 RepID=M5XEW5_PRUPE|nr:hypothetical protein PRUPE_1G159400 [Prunus persica]
MVRPKTLKNSTSRIRLYPTIPPSHYNLRKSFYIFPSTATETQPAHYNSKKIRPSPPYALCFSQNRRNARY